MSEKDKIRYQSRKSAGFCTQCGKFPALINRMRCEICRDRQRKNQSAYGYKHWRENKEKLYLKSRVALLKKWGLSYEEWLNILEKQEWRCGNKACKKRLTLGKGKIATDHNHVTGKFRGILCVSCNIILGHSKDNKNILEGLIIYLDKNPDPKKIITV